jgi:predicted outer membrane protein
MKRSFILALLLCSPVLLSGITILGSCSSDKEQVPQKVTVINPKEEEKPAAIDAAMPPPPTLSNGLEAGALPSLPPPPQPPAEIATKGEGVQVLLTAFDSEITECQTAQGNTTNYDVKTFSDTVVHETTIATRRLNDLANKKGITPETNDLTTRMRFESESATGYLMNLLPGMYDRTFMGRRVESHGKMLKLIDDKLPAVIGDDEDLKKELATTRKEVAHRLDRAQKVAAKLRGTNNAPPGF